MTAANDKPPSNMSAPGGGFTWRTLAGPAWMVAACFMFAVLGALIRHITSAGDVHPFIVVFCRNLFGFFFMAPWLMANGIGALRTKRLGLYLIRATISLGGMLTWFTALSIVPIADATAISFATALFGTVLAVAVLRETVRMRRWTATAIGFVGVMIILRPTGSLGQGELLALVAAMFMAAGMTTAKLLSRTESANAIVTYMNLMLVPLTLIPALFVWETPAWDQLIPLAGVGAIATIAHLLFTRGMAAADSSLIMPFDYSRMIFAAAIGYFVFGELPDAWTWIGSGVVAAAAIYIAHREARVAPEPTPRQVDGGGSA